MPASRLTSVGDRRAVSKAARRQSIIDSALALTSEHGPAGFSVDVLAEHAGVSRRTVFNYFGSLNEILLAAHARVMDVLVEDFEARSLLSPSGAGTTSSVFDEIAALLHEVDLVGPMSTLTSLLESIAEGNDPVGNHLIREVINRTTEQLAADAARRGPDVDPLDIDLLVHSLLGGIVVIHTHWMTRTGGTDTAESRIVWDGLLEQLITTVRTGYPPAG